MVVKRGPDFNWEGMLKWWNAHSDGSHSPVSDEDLENAVYDDDSDGSHSPVISAAIDVVNRVSEIADCFDDTKEDDRINYYLSSAEFEELLDELQCYDEYIGVANELHSIDGLASLFDKVLCYKTVGMYNIHPGVRAKAAELVTTMVQNNPKNQQLVMEVNGLQSLLCNFISDPDVTSRAKALGAIFALLWNNEPGIAAFRVENGYAALKDALGSGSVRFQRETLNLIQYLLLHENENSSYCNIVTELGFPHIMMHLASMDDAEVREAALRCLLVLARDEEGGNSGQLVKSDDKLKQVLQERIERISAMAPEDLGAAREEIQLLDSLWNACYNESSSLGEKGLLVLPSEVAPAPFLMHVHPFLMLFALLHI